MHRLRYAAGLPPALPTLAVLAVCYGFVTYLMMLFVQLNVTIPLDKGEFGRWLGTDLPVMMFVNSMWMVLLAIDVFARGEVLAQTNRGRLVANSLAVILLSALTLNMNQWQGI